VSGYTGNAVVIMENCKAHPRPELEEGYPEYGAPIAYLEANPTVGSEFEQSSIDSLMGSFANWVTMLKDVESRRIQPLISAGKIIVPPGYASVMRTPVTWDGSTDQLLNDLVNSHGKR
jgi:hypothetical protein